MAVGFRDILRLVLGWKEYVPRRAADSITGISTAVSTRTGSVPLRILTASTKKSSLTATKSTTE